MADIVQRGLSLQVEAEDLASGTITELAAVLDELGARAEDVFSRISMTAQDAASALADAANLFSPEWETQLEEIGTFADGVFADLTAQAATASSGIATAAGTMSDAWTSALDSMKGGTEGATGSLDALQTDMEDTAGVAGTTADEIGSAYSSDALKLDEAGAGLEGLQGDMQATAGVAAETAGEISSAYDSSALGLDAGSASLDALQRGFDETATVAEIDAAEVAGYWDAEALDLAAGGESLKTLQTDMKATAKTAKTTADEVSTAWDTDALTLDAGGASLKDLQGQMDDTVVTAQADAKKIQEAYAGIDTSALAAGDTAALAGDTALAGGAAAHEGGSSPGVSFGKGKTKSGDGLKLPTLPLSDVMTGGITAALGLGGVDIAISQLEGLEALKAQTGMDWQQTLTTAAAAKGIGLDTAYVQKLISRLDTSIGKLDQKAVLSATAEGTPISMGLGRTAVNPSTLQAIEKGLGAQGGAALALKTLGVGPTQLTGMSGEQQLAVIATKLEELKQRVGGAKGNTLANTIISELFGRGTETAVLLEKFTQATTEAQKNMPKGLAKDLQETLGGGSKSMIDVQQSMFFLEVEMSASLMKIAPVVAKLLEEAAKHTTLLEAIALAGLGSGVANKMLGLGGDHGLGSRVGKHGGAVGKVAKRLAPYAPYAAAAAEAAAPAAAVLGPTVALAGFGIYDAFAGGKETNLGKHGDNQILFERGGKAYRTTVGGRGGQVTERIKAADLLQLLSGAKTAGFKQKDSVSAIAAAAQMYGIDPEAMMADSYAESSLNPHAMNKGHAGAFQFDAKTWAADTRKYAGQALPFSDAQNPYISAIVAAAAMHGQGMSGEKGKSALADMIVNFERAGGKLSNPRSGNGADWAHGLPFLEELQAGLAPAQAGRMASPVSKGATFERVDQGVDLYSSVPYKAIADGVVAAIGKFGGGSNTSVYEKLNKPIKVNGHTYDEVYYAETDPLVRRGQHLKAGQNVTAAGYSELGFAVDNMPAGPLVGGLGKKTKPTAQGQDFLTLLNALNGSKSATADADLKKILTAMETDIRNANPRFQKAFDTSMLALLKMLDKYRPQLGKHTDQMLTEMETFLKAGKDPFSKQGEQLMLGLLDGLKRQEPALLAEVNKIVSQMESKMRQATQTHSPSEMTARIGDDLMAGLRVGLQRSTGEAAAAAGAGALHVAGQLGAAPAGGGQGVGGTQVITVELDGRTLTQYVQKQMHQNAKLIAKFN